MIWSLGTTATENKMPGRGDLQRAKVTFNVEKDLSQQTSILPTVTDTRKRQLLLAAGCRTRRYRRIAVTNRQVGARVFPFGQMIGDCTKFLSICWRLYEGSPRVLTGRPTSNDID